MNSSEIPEILGNFVAGKLALEELEEWVVDHLQTAADSPVPEVRDWIERLDTAFMEFGDGSLDKDGLFGEIDAVLRLSETVIVPASSILAHVDSNNSTLRLELNALNSPVSFSPVWSAGAE